MAAQKQKELLTEVFGIFECLLAQNTTNQDSQLSWFFQTIWNTVIKSKNTGFQGIISAWKLFQNLLHSKIQIMAEKRNFLVFRALFYMRYISNQNDLLQGEALAGVLLEERKRTWRFKIIKKSVMAAKKCKNILLQAVLKDFWSSANPKLKSSLSKLALF